MSSTVNSHAHTIFLALINSTPYSKEYTYFGLVVEKRIPIKLHKVVDSIIPPVDVGTSLSKIAFGSF